jgi:hypothetical protein
MAALLWRQGRSQGIPVFHVLALTLTSQETPPTRPTYVPQTYESKTRITRNHDIGEVAELLKRCLRHPHQAHHLISPDYNHTQSLASGESKCTCGPPKGFNRPDKGKRTHFYDTLEEIAAREREERGFGEYSDEDSGMNEPQTRGPDGNRRQVRYKPPTVTRMPFTQAQQDEAERKFLNWRRGL